MNDADRARWLEPSPPIAVDGEEPSKPPTAPQPPPRPADLEPPGTEDEATSSSAQTGV